MRAEQVNDAPRLTLAQYQAQASASNMFAGSADAAYNLRFGLFGEIGGLLAAVKKERRDLTPADHHSVTEELGDALWYLTIVASTFGHELQSIGGLAVEELQRRLKVQRQIAAGNLTFEVVDGLLAFCGESVETLDLAAELSRLGSHAGQLLHFGSERDLADQVPEALLANIFADMALTAALFQQTLSGVARANLEKIASRWPATGALHVPFFDEGMSELERFPRELEMHFIERHSHSGTAYVVQQLNGVNIGDRLTDNRLEPDGYRFHDVFHLAYMVHLGWSPVIRALLKLKRKSAPALDENEDGARAMIIEEGIATWIFNQAAGHRMFAEGKKGRIGYQMLKQVRDMVSGYEVSGCPLWQWELAILDGFRVFQELYTHGGGIVTADLNNRTLTFRRAEPKSEAASPAPAPKRPMLVGAALPPEEFAQS